MNQWRTDRPPDHGYYLGAWKRGDSYRVSELWFNPDAHGSGWFPARGYLHERVQGYQGDTIPVEAWMPIPAYPPVVVVPTQERPEHRACRRQS